MKPSIFRTLVYRNNIRIASQRYSFLKYQRSLSASGWFQVGYPYFWGNEPDIQQDDIIVILRNGQWETSGIVEGIDRSIDKDSKWVAVASGGDQNSWLKRRIVPFAPRSTQAFKVGYAGDIAKTIITENLVSPSDTSRAMPTTFSVEANKGDGISLTYEMPYMNVEEAVQDLMDASIAGGSNLYYDIVKTGETSYQFRTYAGYKNDNSNSALFKEVMGNLKEPHMGEDWADMYSTVYYTYRGSDAMTQLDTVRDDTRLKSIYSRREGYIKADNELKRAAQAAAETELRDKRPRRIFDFRLLDNSPYSKYGQQWYLGTRCKVMLSQNYYIGLVRAVYVEYESYGSETVVGYFEVQAG